MNSLRGLICVSITIILPITTLYKNKKMVLNLSPTIAEILMNDIYEIPILSNNCWRTKMLFVVGQPILKPV